MMSGRRFRRCWLIAGLAGDRSWRHDHYLKNSLFCGQCGSRLGFSYSRGKGGKHYPYFFCLGRNRKRTDCDLPYLPADDVEKKVIAHWRQQKISPELVADIRASVTKELATKRQQDKKLLTTQKGAWRSWNASVRS